MVEHVAKWHCKDNGICSFFDEKLFFRIKKPDNKNDILRMMCDELCNEGIVDKDFYSLVIEREGLGSTNMDEAFALAHPIKPMASSTKVAVAILDEAIMWNNKEAVSVIFLLAIQPGIQEGVERLYDIFIDLVNNTKLQQKITQSKNYQEFITHLTAGY